LSGKTNKPTKELAKQQMLFRAFSNAKKNCISQTIIVEYKQMFKTTNGNNKCKLTCGLLQVKKLHDAK
jgi:GTP:adenosylcobinamide-phosphate guanylyltransferase